MSASGLCYVNHHLCLSPQEEQDIQQASCVHLVDSHPDQQQKMVLCWGLDLLQHQQLGDLDLQVVQVQCLDLQAVQVLDLDLQAVQVLSLDLQVVQVLGLDLQVVQGLGLDLQAVRVLCLDLRAVQVLGLDLQAVQVLGLGLRVGEAAVNSPSASSQLLRLLPPLHPFPLLSHPLCQQVGAAL